MTIAQEKHINDFYKLLKIVSSCKTLEQLDVARNCVKNFNRMYPDSFSMMTKLHALLVDMTYIVKVL